MERAASVGALDAYYSRAFELLHSASGSGAFDLTQEPAALRDRYGRNPHGQSVLQARRLVERGVPLVTVFWPSDGIKNVSRLLGHAQPQFPRSQDAADAGRRPGVFGPVG